MRLYLDDDSVERLLVRLLRNSGHDVETPIDASLVGRSDVVQLNYAVKTGRVILSHNNDDFADLHMLVENTGGTHPGILVVCRENNPRRDMTSRGIVRALEKLIASGISVKNHFAILNNWR